VEVVTMFERLSASFALAQSSWRVLRTDKKLIVFPFLSGVSCFLVLAAFALPFLAQPQWLRAVTDAMDANNKPPTWVYPVVFAYYFCNYFVIIFFNAALVSCALIRFNGETPTLGDGLAAAGRCLPQILAWALVSATVGLLLKMVENAHEKAGAFISALLGTAWTVMTYFVVPVLVVERVGPIAAIGRSLSILRRTWGEALVGRLGLGLFLFLLALPGVLLLLAGGAVATQVLLAPGIALIVLGVLYLVLVSAAGSALQGIFVGALYEYAARGRVPDGFDGQAIQRAFGAK
jgi:hypothetical protein